MEDFSAIIASIEEATQSLHNQIREAQEQLDRLGQARAQLGGAALWSPPVVPQAEVVPETIVGAPEAPTQQPGKNFTFDRFEAWVRKTYPTGNQAPFRLDRKLAAQALGIQGHMVAYGVQQLVAKKLVKRSGQGSKTLLQLTKGNGRAG